jgi:hypothetical protein
MSADEMADNDVPECDACSNPEACNAAKWCQEYDAPLLVRGGVSPSGKEQP